MFRFQPLVFGNVSMDHIKVSKMLLENLMTEIIQFLETIQTKISWKTTLDSPVIILELFRLVGAIFGEWCFNDMFWYQHFSWKNIDEDLNLNLNLTCGKIQEAQMLSDGFHPAPLSPSLSSLLDWRSSSGRVRICKNLAANELIWWKYHQLYTICVFGHRNRLHGFWTYIKNTYKYTIDHYSTAARSKGDSGNAFVTL